VTSPTRTVPHFYTAPIIAICCDHSSEAVMKRAWAASRARTTLTLRHVRSNDLHELLPYVMSHKWLKCARGGVAQSLLWCRSEVSE
jgi:hypothetical protein